jgi:hypothetical protein
MSEIISLDTELEEGLQSSIERCKNLLQYLGCVLESSLESTVSTSDGVMLMKGWYRIINVNGQVISDNNRFICGVVSYLLNLRDISTDICFKSSVARCVTQKFGLR